MEEEIEISLPREDWELLVEVLGILVESAEDIKDIQKNMGRFDSIYEGLRGQLKEEEEEDKAK